MKTKMERFLRFCQDISAEGLTLPGKINMLVMEKIHLGIGAMFA